MTFSLGLLLSCFTIVTLDDPMMRSILKNDKPLLEVRRLYSNSIAIVLHTEIVLVSFTE